MNLLNGFIIETEVRMMSVAERRDVHVRVEGALRTPDASPLIYHLL